MFFQPEGDEKLWFPACLFFLALARGGSTTARGVLSFENTDWPSPRAIRTRRGQGTAAMEARGDPFSTGRVSDARRSWVAERENISSSLARLGVSNSRCKKNVLRSMIMKGRRQIKADRARASTLGALLTPAQRQRRLYGLQEAARRPLSGPRGHGAFLNRANSLSFIPCSFGWFQDKKVNVSTHLQRSPRCCCTLPGPSGTASGRRR